MIEEIPGISRGDSALGAERSQGSQVYKAIDTSGQEWVAIRLFSALYSYLESKEAEPEQFSSSEAALLAPEALDEPVQTESAWLADQGGSEDPHPTDAPQPDADSPPRQILRITLW